MLELLLLLAVRSTASTDLEALSRTLQGAPAWTATFEQRYVPSGFDDGTTDSGSLVLASPSRLRFDYDGEPSRVFAFDGSVARMVDLGAATCDAVRLDADSRGSLPLAVLADPRRQVEVFDEAYEGSTLVLIPRKANIDVAEIRVEIGSDGLPVRFTVVDGAGNRNEFTFSGWRRSAAPTEGSFAPSLPGQLPCEPPGG